MTPAERYADAVCATINRTAPTRINPVDAFTIRDAIARHVQHPDPAWQMILDHPSVANWVLAPDPQHVGRVVLVCRRYRMTDADREREDRTNTALRSL